MRRVRHATAPGRVNLIGEHVDYNGLPVLPMAIEQKVRIEYRQLDAPVVRLVGDGEFRAFAFRLDERVERAEAGHWSNYVRAAARGLRGHGIALERGIEGAVESDLPVAVGLSSSSALVVASALALLDANKIRVERLELAALLAGAERFAGLEGGGMDQAASLCGRRGHALRIDFDPLRATPVAMPAAWRWIVASSLTRAEKTQSAREAYNARRRECKAALARVTQARPPTTTRAWLSPAGAGTPSKAPQTYLEFAAACGPVSPRLHELLGWARSVLEPVLLRRFRHVLTEGMRVEAAQAAMAQSRMAEFGALMTRSHESLRDDYEVSTPELNEIVETAIDAGAAGARLTGAGFGGCAVALCSREDAPKIIDALAQQFYEPRLGQPPQSCELFTARAGDGARVAEQTGVRPRFSAP